jgi:hypothetical protein
MNATPPAVVHDEANRRFEIQVGSSRAELTYLLEGEAIVFTHTGVPSELEGRGLGSALVRAGLDYARERTLKVKSRCWFVDGYIRRHPQVAT